jgi:hypothetical protein
VAKRKLSVKEGRHLIAIITAVVISLLTIYPPWSVTTTLDGNHKVRDYGHHFIFSPPKVSHSTSWSFHVNVANLMLRWFIVLALSGAAWFSMETILRLTGRLRDDDHPSAD